MVGIRQSVLGAVGRHQGRYFFLTAAVRKDRIKIWALRNSRRVTSVATWKKPGETTRPALPAKKLSFQRKYPSADAKDFVFDADLSKTGDLVRTFTKYRDKEGSLFEITGYLFKKFYADKLYWQPRIWGPDGTVQPFVLNTDPLSYDVTKFSIYVNERESFLRNFQALGTHWGGGGERPRTSRRLSWTRTTRTLPPFWPRASSRTWAE